MDLTLVVCVSVGLSLSVTATLCIHDDVTFGLSDSVNSRVCDKQ